MAHYPNLESNFPSVRPSIRLSVPFFTVGSSVRPFVTFLTHPPMCVCPFVRLSRFRPTCLCVFVRLSVCHIFDPRQKKEQA